MTSKSSARGDGPAPDPPREAASSQASPVVNTRYASIRRRVLGIRLPIVALLLIVDAALVWRYYADNEYLYELSRQFISDDQSPSEMAVSAVDHLRGKLRDRGEPGPFLSPAFEFLRPPPREVAERGGDCADRSRLLITLLNLRGVRASKMALYDHEQRSRHAVVTIDIERGKEMVVDALFGLYFPKPSGGYYWVGDLTKDEGILRDRIEQEIAGGEDGFRPRLKKYPYEQYTYLE